MSFPAEEVLAMLACPVCRERLSVAESVAESGAETSIVCTGCARRYPLVDGIPVLIAERALAPE